MIFIKYFFIKTTTGDGNRASIYKYQVLTSGPSGVSGPFSI